ERESMNAIKITAFMTAMVLCSVYRARSAEAQASIPSTLGWYELPNTKIRPITPPDNYNNSGYNFRYQSVNHVRAWNSAVFDTRINRMVTFGGGHTDYYGNELYALDLNTLTISRLTDPGLPFATTCSADIVNGTQPNSRHTYDGIAYMAN